MKIDLPPLPDPYALKCDGPADEPVYNVRKMREYAGLAIQQERERCARLVETTPAEAFCTVMHQGQLQRARETFAAAIRGDTGPLPSDIRN